MEENKRKYCLMNVSHGSGSEFMQIAVIGRELAAKYDELYISAFNKEFADALAAELPNVKSILPQEVGALANSIMREPEEWDVFGEHVYNTSDFITHRGNFYDGFRKLFNLEPKEEVSVPDLEVHPNITESAKQFSKDNPKFIIVQFHGGQNPTSLKFNEKGEIISQYNYEEHGLKRHYPLDKAEKLVEMLNKDGYKVLQYTLPNEPKVKGTISFDMINPQLLYHELAKYADGIITIDSSLQHLAVKHCKKMVVVWVQTWPNQFGYNLDKVVNIQHNKPTTLSFNGLPESPFAKYAEPEEIYEAYKNIK